MLVWTERNGLANAIIVDDRTKRVALTLCHKRLAGAAPARRELPFRFGRQSLLFGGDNELRRIVAAHAVDCSGCACAYRIGVAAWLLSHNRYRPVCAARNRRTGVKRRGGAKVQDEPGILRLALERDCGSRLHTEWSVRFGAGDIRRG